LDYDQKKINGNSLLWNPMTIDEYAIFQIAQGIKTIKIADTWWVEIRPFFFCPLLPYHKYLPKEIKYPFKAIIGGAQHAISVIKFANSTLQFFVYDNLQNYSLDILSSKRRNTIRKGEKNFYFKKINDISEFINNAFDIYSSFQNRTNYNYKEERLNIKYFRLWAEKLFSFPKVLILGVYHFSKLSAISISYMVRDIVIDATFFSDSQSQKLQVTDYVLHIIRSEAARTEAKYIVRGAPTGIKNLDNSKLKRGCKILSLPAYLHINPVAEFLLKIFMKKSYNKLLGNF